jgi:5-methylthioadenosine/S-adenosylhomocysteine deaminase
VAWHLFSNVAFGVTFALMLKFYLLFKISQLKLMQIIDTLIHARWIIPIEPTNLVYEHYSLAIHEGKILGLLPTELAILTYHSDNIIELKTHALTAGFINAHTHAAMTLMRGIADDLPLMDWLQNHIWVLENKWMSEEFVRDGTDLAIAEMLRGGTTCFNDMYFFPDVAAQRAIKHGIRASLGLIVIDFPTVWGENSDEYIQKGLSLHHNLKTHELITTPFAPHAPYTVSDEPLKRINELAQDLKLPVHIHLHETAYEIESALAQNGERPMERLKNLGLINDSLIAVHATQLSNDEIQLLADSGASIVHCPESNLKLASGFCPVAKCLAAGINVALGTDGAASNNDLDMLGEMRTAALIGKAVANDASVIPAMTALRMATINGAKALGLENKIGSLEIGKSADIIAIDLSDLETQPLYCPISQIVYAASRHQVTDVWVAGEQLLTSRHLTTFDLKELKETVEKWRVRLIQPTQA